MDRNNSILDCIYKSILEKNIRQAKILLEIANVNPNEILPDRGINILHLAAGLDPEEYSKQISEIIISHGGNPNECSDDGMTPLHVAAAWGRLSTVKMLIEHGGNVHSQDDDGKTPLDYANEHIHTNVIKYLKDEVNCQLNETNSPDKYRLKLDKIIVHNGIVEGEYIPAGVSDEAMTVEAFKKSEIISEWFARSPKLRSSYVYDEEVTPVNKKCNFDSQKDEKNSSISMVTANDIQLSFKNSTDLETSKKSSLYRSCIASFNEIRKSLIDSHDVSQLNGLSTQETEAEDHSSSSDHSLSGVVPIEFTRTSYNKLFSVFLKQSNVDDNTKQSGAIECPGTFAEFEPFHPTSLNRNYSKSQMGFETYKVLNIKSENFQDSTILTSHRSDKSYDIQADRSSSEESQISDCFNKALMTSDDFINSFDKVSTKDINNRQFGTMSKDIDHKMNISKISQSNESLNSSTNIIKSSQNRSAHVVNETLANIAEEYKYEDEQAGVALIEKRILVTPVPLASESYDGSVALSIASSVSSLPMALDYDTDSLRKELISLGAAAGPITVTTKRVYLKRLQKLRKAPVMSTHQQKEIRKTYSLELEKTFRDVNWNSDLSSYVTLERQIANQFAEPDPSKRWREGITKSSFTYLLLDPRSTQNLPCRAEITPRPEIWHSFIESIFYIGKGKRSRPYSHLYQAVTLYNAGQIVSEDKKVQYILDIWKENLGVVCLHIFQNVIPVEAYSREAAMIEVIGLKNLKNLKTGNYYGIASTWPLRQKKLLGVYLLYKAMLIFLSEGERQLRPADIG